MIRRILDRTRARFNVAAAEVGSMDDRRRAVLGFAVVSNDGRHANSMLDAIARFAESCTDAVVADRSLELVQAGDSDWSSPGGWALDAGDPWQDDDGLGDEPGPAGRKSKGAAR